MKTNIIKTAFVVSCLISSYGFASTDLDYQKWLKSYKKEYQTFVDEYDKEFAQFLKDNWVETDVEAEKKRDQEPKPEELPTAKEQPVDDPKPVPVVIKPIEPVIPSVPVPVPEESEPEPDDEPIVVLPPADPYDFSNGADSRKMPWLGLTVTLPKMNVAKLASRKISAEAISDNWLTMAKTNFKPLTEAFSDVQLKMNLDDWGLAVFVNKYIKSQIKNDELTSRLYTWFYLVKQGFDARVSYADSDLYLMLNVEQSLFGVKYFNMDDKPFYFVDLDNKKNIKVGRVYTYNKQHSSASKSVAINLASAPIQGQTTSIRKLESRISGKDIHVEAPYSKDYVDFLDYYPQLEMKYYFEAEMAPQTKQALLSQLASQMQGMSEVESLNFLLRFVQTGLAYQTDQEQFNYENYLMTTETIHYPYADCEDRSVLYAYLVKNLLGNEVVGVQYDGHIATAVKVKSSILGDKYSINGESFVVADPTYINANVGSVMPQFKNKSAKFIVF
jgi:hypothetical protein